MEKEVGELMDRLRFMQEDLHLDIPEGVTVEEDEKGFQALQSKILNQISEVKDLIEKRNEMTERGANRRKVIEVNASVYKKLKDIAENYEKLKEKYEKDKKKRIRKLSPEELKDRMDALAAIQSQIEQVQEKSEEGQKAMTLDTSIGFAEATSFEIKKPEAQQGTQEKKKELFGEVETAVGGGGPDLTESQQQGLVQIERNQQEVDQILEMISSGIDDLQGMAQGMGDEISKQNKMLDEVETTVDRTNEHMQKVQAKMHDTLQKTRGGDKFCMDMVLIFIIVAVGLLIVKIFT
ncbi:syntaxin-71 [Blastocystis sp. ATCC 50177/Nand II]|uniref:Syntaxin-71 n=1 Tax=Blastocystis sp. subtype 1 (strain ATCC 50177 / NandII) TaxID=478820 RepID=A0A196SJZ4_BLAHN|nr:syntaxin-71 [Blastocystis sp. ATCC 50177/Nand II]